jgi:hypothetical protein
MIVSFVLTFSIFSRKRKSSFLNMKMEFAFFLLFFVAMSDAQFWWNWWNRWDRDHHHDRELLISHQSKSN